jgi:hypothetical protein
MAERLPGAKELRAHARRHREEALKTTDAEKRRVRLAVALEYDKLAYAVEAERGFAYSGRDPVAS